MYSINATFVTSCNTTKVRDLDVIVSRPFTQINAKRISIFCIFRGKNDRPEWMCYVDISYMFIINVMRSCNERTTLHSVYSYLYFIISVKKRFMFGGVKRGRK